MKNKLEMLPISSKIEILVKILKMTKVLQQKLKWKLDMLP